jgi:TolA-binding protein
VDLINRVAVFALLTIVGFYISTQFSVTTIAAKAGSKILIPKSDPVPTKKNNPVKIAKPTIKKGLSQYTKEFYDFIGLDDFNQAQVVLHKIEEIAPGSLEYYESNAIFLYKNDELDEAKVALKECLQVYPNSQTCTVYLANTYHIIGTESEQQASVEECYLKFPKYPDCRYLMGRLRVHQKNYTEAILIYQELIRDNKSFKKPFFLPMLNWDIGAALVESGRSAEALTYLEKSCKEKYPEACEKIVSIKTNLNH